MEGESELDEMEQARSVRRVSGCRKQPIKCDRYWAYMTDWSRGHGKGKGNDQATCHRLCSEEID